jgi:hypothetical protein
MRLPDLRRPRNSSVHWPGSDRGARATQGNTSAGHSGRQLEDSPLSPRCSPSARCCLVAHWRRGGPLHKERLGTTCRLRNSRAALRGRAVVRLAPRIRRASHQQRSSREGHRCHELPLTNLHLFSSSLPAPFVLEVLLAPRGCARAPRGRAGLRVVSAWARRWGAPGCWAHEGIL